MLNVGLLGAGRIGCLHAQTISAHPGSTLSAVSDAIEENASRLARQFGAVACSSESILADTSIDAVLIATPTDTHSDLIEMATREGKAVLCEKPVDLSLQRARVCQEVAARAPVMIGFNRRFDPNFSAMKASIEAGEIGRPELLSITSFDPAPPPVEYIKVSGGLFRDMMIHDFDMSAFLMDGMPETVSTTASSVIDPEIGAAGDVDTAVVTMTYSDGRIAVIRNSRRAVYGYDQRIEVLGSTGLLQAQNVPENTLVKSTTAGVTAAKPTYFFLERYMAAYQAEWAAFVDAVKAKIPMPVTLEDGVAALLLAEAATLSLQENRIVRISELTYSTGSGVHAWEGDEPSADVEWRPGKNPLMKQESSGGET